MDNSQSLASATAGLTCQATVLAIAVQYPALTPQLIEIVTSIRKDVAAGGTAASSNAKTTSVSPASASAAALSPQLPACFATVREVACIVPRGKHDIEFHEHGITFRPSTSASKAAASASSSPAAAAVVVHAHNVTGVFSLTTQDKYNKGAAGTTQLVVITLASPIGIGAASTQHSTLCFSETGPALLKAGTATVTLSREVDLSAARDATGFAPAQLAAGAAVTGEHAFAVLRRLLPLAFGRVGEHDRAIFSSAKGDSNVKCYSKVRRLTVRWLSRRRCSS